jgi:hypothetical protein
MADLERMRGELLRDVIDSTTKAVSDIIDRCRDDLPDDLHRHLSTYELVVGATPELVFKEVAPIVHKNRPAIDREDIETIKSSIRAHVKAAVGSMGAVDRIFGFALEWWQTAPAEDREFIKKRLVNIAEDYSDFLAEGLTV